MKIGFVGLGKLGLPVAVCINQKGHDVIGYDVDPSRMSKDPQPYQEAGPDGTGNFNDELTESTIRFADSFIDLASAQPDIIFVAVQTPHDPAYEGISELPTKRVDFDYRYLQAAVADIADFVEVDTPLVVISTCLPGTMRREIMPLLGRHLKLVYNPFFIAMGTTMRDFLDPEFVLLGVESTWAAERVRMFYSQVYPSSVPIAEMSIESAELTKVSYNTFISLKIAFANTVMEICDRIDKADCDQVVDALSLAHRRLISPAYLRGGMGDGGGCHPRDNIAMSWLAKELDLSYDLFDSAMGCREKQARFLARLLSFQSVNAAKDEILPIFILGYAFKPETNLTVGSPALLVADLCSADVALRDSSVTGEDETPRTVGVYLIGCKHARYIDYKFPVGSVVVDPHRYIPNQRGVKVIRLGEAR